MSLVIWNSRCIIRRAAYMPLHNLVFALLISYWYQVHAQQLCYWHDGSDASNRSMTSCYPSQDSTCCWPGDVCLSNALCFSAVSGTVRSTHHSSPVVLPFSIITYLLVPKLYRGACTVRDWSNSTVCLADLCPEGNVSSYAQL